MLVNLTLQDNRADGVDTGVDLDGVGTIFGKPELRNDGRLHTATTDKALQVSSEQVELFAHSSASIEELRLVQRLFFLNGMKGPRTVVFCGVESDDGAVEVYARTGEILGALAKQPVCLIDADMRSPSLHWRYNIDNTAGFADTKPEFWKDKVRHIDGYTFLSVLPAGILKADRPILFPANVRDCLKTLQAQFDYILIGAPPLCRSAEAVLLGQMTDGVVLVIKAHSTPRALALKAKKNLDEYNVRLLGAVLNRGASACPGAFRGTR